MLVIITVAALLQLKAVPLVLTFPLFLIPIGIYTTTIGFTSRKEPHKTEDHSYYFTWAGIILAVGIGWIVFYEGFGVIIGIISVLSITLGFVYLSKIKSSLVNI